MKDINGVELWHRDQVLINEKNNPSPYRYLDVQEISVVNGKYFLVGPTRILLTQEIIKKYKITFSRRISIPEVLIKW